MPENYIQILMLLTTHADGLTTAGILKECEKARYTGIKDIKMASNLVYNMRNQGYIITSDAVGGKIHRIARKGAEALLKEHAIVAEAPIENSLSPTQDKKTQEMACIHDNIDNLLQQLTVQGDIIVAYVDSNLAQLRADVADYIERQQRQQIKIANKDHKLAVLEHLSKLLTTDIADTLTAIHDDLDNLNEV